MSFIGKLSSRRRDEIAALVEGGSRRTMDEVLRKFATMDRRIDELVAHLDAVGTQLVALTTRIERAEEQKGEARDALTAVSAASSANFQALMPIHARLDFLERCLGVDQQADGVPTPDPVMIERLLELRLSQLETRLMTYLEGPYLERLEAK